MSYLCGRMCSNAIETDSVWHTPLVITTPAYHCGHLVFISKIVSLQSATLAANKKIAIRGTVKM